MVRSQIPFTTKAPFANSVHSLQPSNESSSLSPDEVVSHVKAANKSLFPSPSVGLAPRASFKVSGGIEEGNFLEIIVNSLKEVLGPTAGQPLPPARLICLGPMIKNARAKNEDMEGVTRKLAHIMSIPGAQLAAKPSDAVARGYSHTISWLYGHQEPS